MVQLLFESYIIWIDAPKPLNEGEYASEKEFYFSFLLTGIGKSCKTTSKARCTINLPYTDYLLLVLMFQLWTKVTNGSSNKLDTMYLVKAMTLAKIAKFFMIPVVIWSKNASDSASLRLVLVDGYYFFSLMHVLSVLTERSRKSSTLMTLLTVTVKHIVMVELTHRLRNLVMI